MNDNWKPLGVVVSRITDFLEEKLREDVQKKLREPEQKNNELETEEMGQGEV
jgi:hypothetical protein